ncbi:MAG: PAS domain S-box protein [Spirochaetes bacterium]|nr:PAS domain S-box protein [Spirochaetota bacterium]
MDKTRILIVEDNAIIANDLARELGQWGYDVPAIASKGREALDAIERHRPDLIILDIDMPGGMDGIQTAGMIREEYGIPFIYLTAYSDDSLISRAKETGPYGYILKPYRSNELRITIEMALSAHEIEKRLREVNSRLEREVDERRRAENMLKESEERYFSLFNNSIEMVCVADLNGVFIDANRKAFEAMGYTKDDLGRASFTDLLEGEDLKRVIVAVKEIVRTGKQNEIAEYRVKKKNGDIMYVESTGTIVYHQGEPTGIIIIGRDITKRKLDEAALRKSGEKYRDLVEQMNDVLYKVRKDGTLIFVSGAVRQVLGFSPDELEGRNYSETIYEEDVESIIRDFGEALAGNRTIGEYRIKTRSGDVRWAKFSSRPYYEQGEPAGILGVMSDITLRRLAVEELRSSNERLAATLNALPDYMFELDGEGRFWDYRTPRDSKLTISPETFIGKTVHEVMPESTHPVIFQAIDEAKKTGLHRGGVYSLPIRGSVFWFELSIAAMGGPRTSDVRLVALARDITERKRSEEALRLSEEKFSRMFQFSPVSLAFSTLTDGRYLDVNEAFVNLTGFSRGEVVGRSSVDLGFWADSTVRARIRKAVSSSGIVLGEQVMLRTGNGSLKTVLYSAVRIDVEGQPCIVSAAEDITERIRYEEALDRSRGELQSVFDGAPIMMCVVGQDRKVLRGNRAFKEFSGWEEGESVSAPACGVLGCVNALDDSRGCGYGENCASCALLLAIEGTFGDRLERTGVEKKLAISRGGRVGEFFFLASTTLLHPDKSPDLLLCLQDITAWKRAEQSLVESEQKLKAVVDGSSIPQFFIDTDRRVVYWNKALERISGIQARDIIGTRDQWRAFYTEERPCIADLLLDTEGAGSKMEQWYGDKYRKSEYVDGAVEAFDYFPNLGDRGKWLHFTATAIRSINGDIIGAIETLVDITGRRTAEMALQESERKYRELVENANSIILRMDPQGNVTFFNEFAEGFFGFGRNEIIGRNVVGTIVPQLDSSGKNQNEMILDIARDPEKYKYNENENIKKSGERVWISWTNKVIIDDSETIREVLCIGVDVTERRRAEEELAESEKKYRELADFMPEIIFEIDENGSLTYANRAAFPMMGYQPEEMVQIQFIELFAPEDRERLMKNYFSIRNGERSVPHEYTVIRRDGTRFPVIINSRAKMIDGSYRGARGIVVDITERRRIEAALRESEEKFHSLFTGSGDAQLLMEGALIVDCNNAAMNIMGCADRDEIVGQYIQKFFPDMQPDGRISVLKGIDFLERAIEEKSLKFEWQHRRADGLMFMAEVVFTAIPIEGKVLFHTTLRDITDRKLLQEQIINIVDIEQQRLGQNLHDGLGQDLTGVAFLSSSLTKRLRDLALPEAARSEEVTSQVYHIITMVRTLSRELYPPNLVENEISFTLADFAANIEKMFGISCVFEQDEDLVISNINVSTQIYFITREAVNNAIRHGKARNIIIKLTTDADRVILMISDDGTGIPEMPDQTRGLGLRIMAYRMESIHGTFSVRQIPGGGTQVTCTMPGSVILEGGSIDEG